MNEERMKQALYHIMAEVALPDDDREPDLNLIFDLCVKALNAMEQE